MTRLLLLLCLAISLLAQPPSPPAAPASNERIYVVTHVDLMGPFAAEGGILLTAFATQALRDPGAVRYEVLVEPSRLNHVTLVSVWENRAIFEKHLALPHTVQFREKLQPMLGGPLDERWHVLMK